MEVATYWKVPFEWLHEAAPSDGPDPAGVTWHRALGWPNLVQLVGVVLAGSVGPEDRLAVETLGTDAAAERILSVEPGFGYRPEWWQVVAVDGTAAGFVLPVIYEGCARDGLDEATIYHMGVAPEHRGSAWGDCCSERRPGSWSITASGGSTATRRPTTLR